MKQNTTKTKKQHSPALTGDRVEHLVTTATDSSSHYYLIPQYELLVPKRKGASDALAEYLAKQHDFSSPSLSDYPLVTAQQATNVFPTHTKLSVTAQAIISKPSETATAEDKAEANKLRTAERKRVNDSKRLAEMRENPFFAMLAKEDQIKHVEEATDSKTLPKLTAW